MNRAEWSLVGKLSDDDPDMVFFTAANPLDDADILYTCARVKRRKGKSSADVAVWETPDGEYIDDTALSMRAKKLAVKMVVKASPGPRV